MDKIDKDFTPDILKKLLNNYQPNADDGSPKLEDLVDKYGYTRRTVNTKYAIERVRQGLRELKERRNAKNR